MKKWLKVLLAADFFIILAMGMIAPIYAIFVENIGGDILDAGGTWAIFALTSGILLYIIGKWQDKKKHYAKMLFIGYSLRALGFLGYMFVQNTYHLFAVQIILGISLAIAAPAFDALYSTYLQKGKYAGEWGTWEAMNMIVTAIAALMGAAIAKYIGFRALFMMMFFSGVFGAAVSSILMQRNKKK